MNAGTRFASMLIAAGFLAGAAYGQAESEPQVRHVVVYGSDPCPPSSTNDVVICARRPETERYRIPRNMREPPPSPESESWAERAQALERVGRTGIQSCSPVGPGGASGCLEQLIQQAREERHKTESTQGNAP